MGRAKVWKMTAIVKLEGENLPAMQNRLVPTTHEMQVFALMAKQAVQSKLYKGVGDESAVMTIMLAARELGIPPMIALNKGLQIVEGAVEISARIMNGMIRRAGHSITEKESTDEKCTLVGRRIDNGDTITSTYTIQDAARAGLIKDKGAWKKVPKDMCFARALSRLARQLFADVIGTAYIEGEIKEGSVEVIEQENEPEEDPREVSGLLQQLVLACGERAHGFAEAIRKHYGWSYVATLRELLKDPDKAKQSYNEWIKKDDKDECCKR